MDTTGSALIESDVLDELAAVGVELELAMLSESALDELLEGAADEEESDCIDVTTTVGLTTAEVADVADVAGEVTELGVDTGTETTGEDDNDEVGTDVDVAMVLVIADVVAALGVTAALVLATVCPPISIEADVSWSVWL